MDLSVLKTGYKAGTGRRRNCIIAILGNEFEEHGLITRLRLLGHLTKCFADSRALEGAIEDGARFDLLLLSPRTLSWLSSVFEKCQKNGLPVVLMTHEMENAYLSECHSFAREAFPRCIIDRATLPITDTELAWRIGLAARTFQFDGAFHPTADRTFGRYRFVVSRQRVFLQDRELQLMPREFDVALLLFENANRLLERETVLGLIWGKASDKGRSRVLDVCASKIRKKLELCEANGYELVPIYRRGYELRRVSSRSDRLKDAWDANGARAA